MKYNYHVFIGSRQDHKGIRWLSYGYTQKVAEPRIKPRSNKSQSSDVIQDQVTDPVNVGT